MRGNVTTGWTLREVREHANLTQAQMAPLMGMSLSGYRKWKQGTRRVSGLGATLLRVIERSKGTGGRQACIAVSGPSMTRWSGHFGGSPESAYTVPASGKLSNGGTKPAIL